MSTTTILQSITSNTQEISDISHSSSFFENIIYGLNLSKKQLIMGQVLKTRRNILEDIKCDNFQKPKVKQIVDSCRSLETMANTPDVITSPKLSSYKKVKIRQYNLENWCEDEDLDASYPPYQNFDQLNCYGVSKNQARHGFIENNPNKYISKGYNVHICKAPFTDMAFDLRDYNEVHKNCNHSYTNVNLFLMERISLFRQKMPARCKKSTIDMFDKLLYEFLDLTSEKVKDFKIYRFDPFADAML